MLWAISSFIGLFHFTVALFPDPLVLHLVNRLENLRTEPGFIRNEAHIDAILSGASVRSADPNLKISVSLCKHELAQLRALRKQATDSEKLRVFEHQAYVTASRVAAMTLSDPIFGRLASAVTRGLRFDGYANIRAA